MVGAHVSKKSAHKKPSECVDSRKGVAEAALIATTNQTTEVRARKKYMDTGEVGDETNDAPMVMAMNMTF